MNKQVEIHVPTKENKLLEKVLEELNSNKEIYTLWRIINVNAIDREKLTDHGVVHFQIVSNIALRLSRILHENGVGMGIEKNFDLSYDHAELVVFLASIMHDLGMTVSRDGHEEFSVTIANRLLRELLDFLPIEEKTIVVSEVLHSIISHRKGGKPLTIEAGIIRVADALDMSEGRSRIPYESGDTNIHAISAAAINGIRINKGTSTPIEIEIEMNNSAGTFQIDGLLKGKIKGSGLEKYVQIRAYVKDGQEKNLIKEFVIKDF